MASYLVNSSDSHSGSVLCQRTEVRDIFVPVLLGMAIIIGNTITLLTIRLTPSFRTTPDMYLASLATSDLLIGVTIILNVVINNSCWYNDRTGQVYKYTCLTSLCIGGASGVASVVNLAMMSVDRCMAVSYPFVYRSYDVKRLTLAAIFVCWLSSVIYGFLILPFNRFSHHNKCQFTVQTEVWYLRYLTPCLILSGIMVSAVCYIKIARVFYESDQNFQPLVIRSRKTWTLSSLAPARKKLRRRLCFINAGKNKPSLCGARNTAEGKRSRESIRPDRCDERANVVHLFSDRCCQNIQWKPCAKMNSETSATSPDFLRSKRSCDVHLANRSFNVGHCGNNPSSESLVDKQRVSNLCERSTLSSYLSKNSLAYNREGLISSRLKATLSSETSGQSKKLIAERYCSSQTLLQVHRHGSSAGIVSLQSITQHLLRTPTEPSIPSQSDPSNVQFKEKPTLKNKIKRYSIPGIVSITNGITPSELESKPYELESKQSELEIPSLKRSTSFDKFIVKTFSKELSTNQIVRADRCQISNRINRTVSNLSSTTKDHNSTGYIKGVSINGVSLPNIFRFVSTFEQRLEETVSVSDGAIDKNSHHVISNKSARMYSLIIKENKNCAPTRNEACLKRAFSEGNSARHGARYRRNYCNISKNTQVSSSRDEAGDYHRSQFISTCSEQLADNTPSIKSSECTNETKTVQKVNGNPQVKYRDDERHSAGDNGKSCEFPGKLNSNRLDQNVSVCNPESNENARGSDSGICLLKNEGSSESDPHPSLSRSSSSRSSFQRVLSEKKMARSALAKDLSWNSRRVLKMIFITQIIYTLCMLPTAVIFISQGLADIPDWLLKLSSTLTFLNSFINIFVYAGYSVKYRAAIWSVLMCRFRK
ncbi:hypothetical protein Btru_025452 [Bulinus truncatus]|nr:hypothetical protein Btru_025452 [Bulinus truncatus]